MFTLWKTFRFEAAHHLPYVPPGHKCGQVHGHSYVVTVELRGNIDPDTGWFIDFGNVAAAMKPILATLDHKDLNTILGLENPTAEVIARWIFGKLDFALTPWLQAVTIEETETSKVEYRPVVDPWGDKYA